MKETLPRVFKDGGATPRAQDARRTATGVVAYKLSVIAMGLHYYDRYLQHLNECNTQVEICLVPADQTQAEKEANG